MQSSINPSYLHCAQSGEKFFAVRFFLEAGGTKWERERLLESKLKQLDGKKQASKRKHGSFK